MPSRPLSRRILVLGSAGATAARYLPVRDVGAQDAPADEAENQELRLAAYAVDADLDPHVTSNSRTIGMFTYQMWAGLAKLNEALEAVPDIATRWDVSEDGKVYTFHLDPDRKFADGSPITAHDFVWSWTRALDPESESVVGANYLGYIVGARPYFQGETTEPPTGYKALDDQTLQVELTEPRSYFPEMLVHPTTFVVAQADVEAGTPEAPWYTTAKAFSGPYVIASYTPRESLVLTANPYYPTAPRLQKLTYRLVDDPQTQFLLYENDEVDFTLVDVPDAAHINNGDSPYRDELIIQPLRRMDVLYLRTKQAPFDDERVRRAFYMAVDRDTIRQVVLEGLYPEMNGLYYPGLDTATEDVPEIPFDPEGALAELAQSSYGGRENLPLVEIWQSGEAPTPTTLRLIATLQEMWRQNLVVRHGSNAG